MKFIKTASLLVALSAQAAFATSNCDTIRSTKSVFSLDDKTIPNLMSSLDVQRHSSMDKLSHFEEKTLLFDFFKDVCKIPKKHLAVTQKRGVRFYLTNGPITQHPDMKKIYERGEAPRNHKDTEWIDLPGAYNPTLKHVVVNIMSLDKGHGAKSLILHEYAHALDYVYLNSFNQRKRLSSSRSFKRAVKKTPWKEIYSKGQYLDPEKYEKSSNFSKASAISWKENAEKFNASLDKSNKVLIDYAKSNSEEHFAELYSMYLMGDNEGEKLQSLLPDAVTYFRKLGSRSARSRGHGLFKRRKGRNNQPSTENRTDTQTSSNLSDSQPKKDIIFVGKPVVQKIDKEPEVIKTEEKPGAKTEDKPAVKKKKKKKKKSGGFKKFFRKVKKTVSKAAEGAVDVANDAVDTVKNTVEDIL